MWPYVARLNYKPSLEVSFGDIIETESFYCVWHKLISKSYRDFVYLNFVGILCFLLLWLQILGGDLNWRLGLMILCWIKAIMSLWIIITPQSKRSSWLRNFNKVSGQDEKVIQHQLHALWCLPWTLKRNGCSGGKNFWLHLRSLDSSPDLRQRSLSLTMMISKRRLNVPPRRRQPSKNWLVRFLGNFC